jgi:hypothetical protein
MSTTFPIISSSQTNPKSFVQFWERLYSGYDEDFYRDNIDQPLTEERIALWFAWKNGTKLSEKKAKSITKYVSPDERIEVDADLEVVRQFLRRPGGAIWRIFWLHLQHPKRFPIYDQHVHRAMAYLLKLSEPEIPEYDRLKVSSYLGVYCPFFTTFAECENRLVDRALWTFGRFLSSDYARIVGAGEPASTQLTEE